MSECDFHDLALRRRADDRALLDGLAETRHRVDLIEKTLDGKLKQAIDEAMDRAVHQVFSDLGVNVDDPTDLQRFRDNLQFGGVFRHAVEKSFYAVLAAIAGAIGLAIWVVFKERMGIK